MWQLMEKMVLRNGSESVKYRMTWSKMTASKSNKNGLVDQFTKAHICASLTNNLGETRMLLYKFRDIQKPTGN